MLSVECRVKPLRRINAIVASCWIYFTDCLLFPYTSSSISNEHAALYILPYHIISSFHLLPFCRSVQDYKIHMDMEIVTFRNQEVGPVQSVHQLHGPVQYLRLQYITNYLV